MLYAPNADNELCVLHFRDNTTRTIHARELVSGRLIAGAGVAAGLAGAAAGAGVAASAAARAQQRQAAGAVGNTDIRGAAAAIRAGIARAADLARATAADRYCAA